MTSIMHPGTYARVNAVQAKQALADAATVLRTGTSLDPSKPSIAVPADQAAVLYAERGIRHITTSLGVGNKVSAGVVTALSAARDQASAGVRHLGTADQLPVHGGQAPGLFDAATMWLDLAVNLIDLDMRGGRTPQPAPITILPLPVDVPATTMPVPSFDVQLPHPDSQVQ